MINMPQIKLAVVGVSRDCFPASLTQKRLAALMAEVKKAKLPNVVACPVTIENENDTLKALGERAVRAGVVWQNGEAFIMPDTIRMNLALPYSQAVEAMERLKKYAFI